MLPIKHLFFALVAGIILTTACANQTAADEASVTATELEEAGEEEAPPINVCEPLDVPDVAFPRQEYVEGPRVVMEAELVGTVVLTDGCLQVDSLYGDGRITPVWPAEFTIALEDESLVVYDGDGKPLIRQDEEVYMGGGEGTDRGMLECVRQQLPDSCDGKYWYVGDGVRPNLRFDSELFDLSLITETERTAIFLQKKPILDDWKESPSTITGRLVLYKPMRCPRVHSESGMSNFMPIWPQGYSLEFSEGNIEIRDGAGSLIAREGDELTLSGGGIPHSWESDEYRQLYYQLPGDCHAPYWIVDK
jgi:hypothetical protein